jgi:plastocyanin
MTQARTALVAMVMMGMLGTAACGDDTSYGGPGNEPQQGVQDGGATGGATTPSGPFVITIADFTFAPDNLVVPAGATVTVRNMDDVPHSVTSQAEAQSYVPGAVSGVSFDTGVFSSGERTFTVAADAPSGTEVPYFCTVHKNAMKNDGRLTIR